MWGLLDTIDEKALPSIALMLETNINASMRVAPSIDVIFNEVDAQEDSFSDVIP